MPILVDSNVILDIATRDPVWEQWSSEALEKNAADGLLTNCIVYSELCVNAESPSAVDAILGHLKVELAEIPTEALFFAAKAHAEYRRRGGSRQTGLPDFFIGGHAKALGYSILTRDKGRYQTYFPEVPLICP